MLSDRLNMISRRDFLRLTSQFGVSSTLLAVSTLTGAISLPRLAEAANSQYLKRFRNTPKFRLRFGASAFNNESLLIIRAGCLQFINDLEERTDGAIRVEFIGSNQVCSQDDCAKKAQEQRIDLFASATHNAASSAPYYSVLEYAFVFPTRASQYYFLYHPDSQKILRDPLLKQHGIQFLFGHAELRGLQLGLKWKDKPPVNNIADLSGAKIAVSGTQLTSIAMNQMNFVPTPLTLEETIKGLNEGFIDGADRWASAVAYTGMAPAVSRHVNLDFVSGMEHTAMNARMFDKIGGELQDAVLESAYLAQVHVQAANEASLVKTVGYSQPRLPATIFAKNNVDNVFLSQQARQEAAQMCAPNFNAEPWAEWRSRLDQWSGGQDTYKVIYDVAREIPSNTLPENVEPRRWWKS